MSKVKIFVIYHKPFHVFRNDVYEPIQTGAGTSGYDLGFLKDNTGDNIAEKNPHYGEMTAWYWVLKNWLPKHPEIQHIGFCHYRRFLDLATKARFLEHPYRAISTEDFIRRFSSDAYQPQAIESALSKCDIALPPKTDFMSFAENFSSNLFDQYIKIHPLDAFIEAARAFRRLNPKENGELLRFWRGTAFHACLNFVMRRDLFENFANWALEFTADIEQHLSFDKYTKYDEIRCPAFLVERYFDLWLNAICQTQRIQIRTTRRWLLGGVPPPTDIPWFLSGIKQWSLWHLGVNKHTVLPTWK